MLACSADIRKTDKHSYNFSDVLKYVSRFGNLLHLKPLLQQNIFRRTSDFSSIFPKYS